MCVGDDTSQTTHTDIHITNQDCPVNLEGTNKVIQSKEVATSSLTGGVGQFTYSQHIITEAVPLQLLSLLLLVVVVSLSYIRVRTLLCNTYTMQLSFCLGVLSFGWSSLCLRMFFSLKSTGMLCLAKILLSFSETPETKYVSTCSSYLLCLYCFVQISLLIWEKSSWDIHRFEVLSWNVCVPLFSLSLGGDILSPKV